MPRYMLECFPVILVMAAAAIQAGVSIIRNALENGRGRLRMVAHAELSAEVLRK